MIQRVLSPTVQTTLPDAKCWETKGFHAFSLLILHSSYLFGNITFKCAKSFLIPHHIFEDFPKRLILYEVCGLLISQDNEDLNFYFFLYPQKHTYADTSTLHAYMYVYPFF